MIQKNNSVPETLKYEPSVIVALDFDTLKEAEQLVETLSPRLCRLKVGSEMYTRFGPAWVKQLTERGFDVFLDLKFHDIPRTVAHSVASAADLGVWMVNVHASGGGKMLDAARKALLPYGKNAPLLIGVTVLTSFSEQEFRASGWHISVQERVLFLAKLAHKHGLDGVVASAQEAAMIKHRFGEDFYVVTPGIRLGTISHDDQVRTMTPAQAFSAGSDFLVMGRSIVQAAEPEQCLLQIQKELTQTVCA